MVDIADMLARPDQLVRNENGKLSLTIARGGYQDADHHVTKTAAAGSQLQAGGNIQITARGGQSGAGDITVQGSRLQTGGEARFQAEGRTELLDAIETRTAFGSL